MSGGLDRIQLGNREVNSRAYCAAFNFKGADQQKKVGALSGGERNRVHLAKCSNPAPTSCCWTSPPTISTLIRCGRSKRRLRISPAAVIVSHDRWFLDHIATHILAFEGESHVESFEGNLQDYEKDKMHRLGQIRLSGEK